MYQFSPKQINLLKILQTSSGYTTINLNAKRKTQKTSKTENDLDNKMRESKIKRRINH